MLEFAECMRDHGVDMPDPQFDGDGGGGGMIEMTADPDDEGFEEAQEACQPILEDAMGEIELDPEQEAEMREQLLEFAECMRDHGIDMPDPVFGEDGRVTMAPRPVSGSSPVSTTRRSRRRARSAAVRVGEWSSAAVAPATRGEDG